MKTKRAHEVVREKQTLHLEAPFLALNPFAAEAAGFEARERPSHSVGGGQVVTVHMLVLRVFLTARGSRYANRGCVRSRRSRLMNGTQRGEA